MKINFKQWLFSKAYVGGDILREYYIDLELIIRAMWAINQEWTQEAENKLGKQYEMPYIYQGADRYTVYLCLGKHCNFKFKDFKNLSENKALEAALQFIFDEDRKKK